MARYLGLDGGGTSLRAVLIDSAGQPLFHGQSGAANIATTPEERFKNHLLKATDGCPEPDAVCGCFAGLLTPDDRERAIRLLRERFPKACLRAEPDYVAALEASGPEVTACIVCGTGSLICSRSEDGKYVRSGGGGYLLGDDGSGFQYGRAALRHYLEVGPEGASDDLRRAVLERFGVSEPHSVTRTVYSFSGPAPMIARLLPAFVADLHAGEPYAAEALREQSAKLARVVAGHLTRYHGNLDRAILTLAGGLWEPSIRFREALAESLRDAWTGQIEMKRIPEPPVRGAARLALALVA